MKKISTYETSTLESMASAGGKVLDCYRVLEKSKTNVVGELIKGIDQFYEWDHHPKGDAYDNGTHSQYYYHAHPSEKRIDIQGDEHGHFHTFVRPKGMPPRIRPAKLSDYKKPKAKNDDICHLVGISMDRKGMPIRLFTVNRWVTGETWYNSDDVIKILENFNMDMAYPSWPVNVWITAMIKLFRPQIEMLVHERDQAMDAHQQQNSEANAYEDRSMEIISHININVNDQVKLVKTELKRR